jgi:hypothetical protein
VNATLFPFFLSPNYSDGVGRRLFLAIQFGVALVPLCYEIPWFFIFIFTFTLFIFLQDDISKSMALPSVTCLWMLLLTYLVTFLTESPVIKKIDTAHSTAHSQQLHSFVFFPPMFFFLSGFTDV